MSRQRCASTLLTSNSIRLSARNLKFYPLSLHEAMQPDGPLAFISTAFRVRLPTCTPASTSSATENDPLFISLTPWQLLNLPSQTILAFPSRLAQEYGLSPKWLEAQLAPYLIQTRGKEELARRYCTRGDDGEILEPEYLIASTKHYSWPKGACTPLFLTSCPLLHHLLISVQPRLFLLHPHLR